MQLSHDPVAIDAVFDEGNLVSCAGLAPVMALGERAGLSELLAEHLSVSSPNAPTKITSLLAGMVAGADSIEDMDLLRHGAMDRLFEDVRAPSTLGTFLRAFTFGHVRQLDAVAARLLAALAGQVPLLPAGRAPPPARRPRRAGPAAARRRSGCLRRRRRHRPRHPWLSQAGRGVR